MPEAMEFDSSPESNIRIFGAGNRASIPRRRVIFLLFGYYSFLFDFVTIIAIIFIQI
jgi:hypothetical protein